MPKTHTLTHTHGHTGLHILHTHQRSLVPYKALCTSPHCTLIPTLLRTHTCPHSLLLLSGIPPLLPPLSRLNWLESLKRQGLGVCVCVCGRGELQISLRESWWPCLLLRLAGPALPRHMRPPRCLCCLPGCKPEVTHLSLHRCFQASRVQAQFFLGPSEGCAAQEPEWLQPQCLVLRTKI